MKNRIAIVLVAAILLVMSLSACGAIKGVSDVGESFMVALRDGDFDTSWELLTTDLQTEIGDKATWTESFSLYNFSDWSFSNTQIENDVAQMDGEATLGQDTFTVVLVFDKVGEAWLVSGINFTLQ